MIVVVDLPRLPLLVALLQAHRPLDMAAALAPEPGTPQVVGMCTPAAAAEGVREGLRVGEAYARCPGLALVPPHPEGTAAAVEHLLARLEAAGCAVEPLGSGGAALDARATWRLHGGLRGVIGRVRAAMPVGADGRIGVAPTLFTAHQAARRAVHGTPLVVAGDEVAGFLAPLPVACLPISMKSAERCRDMGLDTIGSIAALPRSAALERLGFDGIRAWELARGMPDRPLRPRVPPRPLSARIEFADPAGTLGALETAARLLIDELAASAAAAAGAVRTLTVSAGLATGGSWARGITLREATADRARLEIAVLPRLAQIPAPVEMLRIDADASGSPAGHQLTTLPSPTQERTARTREAVRQVRAALGDDVLLRVIPLESTSHIPERRWALAPLPEPPADAP